MSGCVKTSALAMRRAARGASTIPEFVGTGEFGVGTGRPKRVGIPLVLPVDPPPFTSHTVIEPLTPTDRDTMFRQIIKRRAYPVGCASRCRHGYPQVRVVLTKSRHCFLLCMEYSRKVLLIPCLRNTSYESYEPILKTQD